jgi:hypothetical protein
MNLVSQLRQDRIEQGLLKGNPKKDPLSRRARARYGSGAKGQRMAIHLVKGEKTGVNVTEFKWS